MISPPEAPPVAWWSRALRTLPNGKFAATQEVYRRSGLAACDEASSALIDANVEFTYRYYWRLAQLRHAVGRRALHRSIDDRQASALHDALRAGRGVVLASAHLGDFDVAGSWLAQVAGAEVVVVLDDVEQALRQWWFDDVRCAAGVVLRRRDETRLHHVEADLRRGRVVLFMVDRAGPGPSVTGTFLGRPARLAIAPWALARRTGAALIVGSTVTEADGRRVVVAERPPVGAAADVTLAAIADMLSRQIRGCPWQWHVPADVEQLAFAQAAPGCRGAVAEPVGALSA